MDGESSVTEMSAGGVLEREPDGFRLTYEESEEIGVAGVRTVLHVRDGCVTMERTGGMNTLMVMETGRRHMCEYDTGYGRTMIGVYAQEVRHRLTDDGGEVFLRYTLDFNAGLLAGHELHIAARESKRR